MGIAGAILSDHLDKAGYQVTIYNKNKSDCSSRVAAGMFNSIIPRRVTKSWLADDLNPIIQDYYPALEKSLQSSFYRPKDILHVFEYTKEQNDWLSKVNKEEFKAYFNQDALIHPQNPLIHSPLGGVIIKNGGYCHTGNLLDAFEIYFKNKLCYIDTFVDSNTIQQINGKFVIMDQVYDNIVFCEGVENTKNKWFNDLPFKFAKGELLHVKIKGLNLQEILLGGVFLVPLNTENEYLLGSTFEWDFPDAKPTNAAKEKLMKRVRDYIPNASIEILEHRAGIRPAVKDRRPLIGEHPEQKGMYIFNGFGSKAISLAPYFAQQMVGFIKENTSIHEEVDVKRFL